MAGFKKLPGLGDALDRVQANIAAAFAGIPGASSFDAVQVAKDYTATKPDLLIGTGSMDWSRLVRDAQSSAVEWYVIEHDSMSGPDLSDIAESLRSFLRADPHESLRE